MSGLKIQEFCDYEEIPYLPIYYFIKTDEVTNEKKKVPIGEKNNYTIEEINNIYGKKAGEIKKKPTTYWDSKEKKNIDLTKEERKTLTLSLSVFLKHSDNLYCIDIDDPTINSIDDYVKVLEDNDVYNHKTYYDYIKNFVWTKGNTKGIHIYLKIKNLPSYSNQQDVLNIVKGDLIRTNNMWENVDKEIYNCHFIDVYDGGNMYEPIKELDYKIFHSFINGIIDAKKLFLNNTQDKPKEDKIKEYDLVKDELELYINLCINNNVFEKMTGYTKWLNIGIIIKNQYSEDGFNLFNRISEQMPKYDGENETSRFYNDLNKRIFSQDKKPLTIGSLKQYVKEVDNTLYDKINIELKQLLKGSNTDYVFDDKYCYNFNTHYFNTLTTYQAKKQYFELFVCKVLRPQPLYIYSENDNDNYNCLLYSESDIKETFKHLGSSIKKKVKKDEEEKESKFIYEWIDDKKIKLYNRMDFNPYNGIRNLNSKEITDNYNLFNGYNKVITTEYDKTKTDEILKPFKELLFELVGSEQEYFNYFYNFLAHLIQKPSERIPICFIFKSKQGVGKNVMLDVIGNLIGKAHYITSSNPKDFFSDYAEGFYRKLLVNINECEGKDTFDYEGKIKSFITEPTITLNPKFVRQTTISNFARLIIFTNKPNPIPIDVRSKDRRFVVFQSSEKYLNNKYGTTFWTKLIDHFKNPKFLACLYDNLNSIKLDDIKWKESRPITKAYLEMCKLYVPIEAMFLENFIDNKHYNKYDEDDDENVDNYNKTIDIPSVDLYKNYTNYCEEYGYKKDGSYQASMVKFSSKLNGLEININKVKTAVTNVFRFNPQNVYKTMEAKKWIIKKENEINEEELKDIGGEEFNDYFVEL